MWRLNTDGRSDARIGGMIDFGPASPYPYDLRETPFFLIIAILGGVCYASPPYHPLVTRGMPSSPYHPLAEYATQDPNLSLAPVHQRVSYPTQPCAAARL